MSKIVELAKKLAEKTEKKDKMYGCSCTRTAKMLENLWPNGVPVEQYTNLGLIVRILDKIGRIANGYMEDSYEDIIGYGLIAKSLSIDENNKRECKCSGGDGGICDYDDGNPWRKSSDSAPPKDGS